ncbi:MAG: hypothetical protein ABID45_01605 [Patescibacteria group bacterium]
MWRKSILFYAFISVFLWLPLFTQASVFEGDQDGASRTSLDLEGCYVHKTVVDDNGTVWVGCNSPNGIFNSTDGSTWNTPPEGSDFGNINSVAASANSIFIIGGVGSYRTQDGGSTWTELTEVQDAGFTMHYGLGNLYVGTRDGLLNISDDEGDTFSEVTVDADVTLISSISTGPTASNVMYVLGTTSSGDDSLFYSNDRGSSWTDTGITVSGGNGEVYVKPTDANFVVLRGSPDITYTSTGYGGTWNTLSSDMNAVAFAGDRIYVGGKYTDDNGSNWSTVDDTGISSRIKGDKYVAVDPNDTNNVYFDTMTGIAKTTDGGTTLIDMNSGLYGVTVYDISQSTDKNTVWLSCFGGLAKTENFQASTPTWEYPVIADNSIDFSYAVWVDPDNADSVVAGMNTFLQYSSDAGTTWTDSGANMSNGTANDIIEVNGTLYAAYATDSAGGGVLSSTNNGTSWTDTGLSDAPGNALTADTSGNIYAGVGDENDSTAAKRGIYKYNGSSWTHLTGDIEGMLINDLEEIDGDIFAAAGETSFGGVFKSTDQGSSWTDVTANGLASDGWYHAFAHESDDPNNIYVSTARPAGTGSLYKSTDGGNNWFEYYVGLKDETMNSLLFDGLVTGTNTGIYAMTSKIKVTLKPKKKKVEKSRKVKLTVRVKDATTAKKLRYKKKKVKLYKKHKKSKPWKLVKKKKINGKKKVVFNRKIMKKTFFQIRFRANNESYGDTVYKSPRKRVKIKN